MPIGKSSFLAPDEESEKLYTAAKLGAIQSNHGITKPENLLGISTDTVFSAEEPQNDTVPDATLPHDDTSLDTRAAPRKTRSFAPWKPKRILAGAHQGWVRSIAVDPVTNLWFCTGLADAQIKIWDLAAGTLKATVLGHIMGVRSLVVLPKYPYLFSGSEDKTLRCWDLERTNSPAGCQIRDYYGHVGGIYALALHPELDLLFSGGRDSAIRVWDIRSRNQAMVLSGHRGDITSLAAQAGDPQVVSSSMDATVRLWDLRMQRCHLTLTHHTKSVRSLAMHPHEYTMVSGDSAGNIKQWVLPSGQLLNNLEKKDADSENNVISTLAINPALNELFAGYHNGKMQFFDYETGDFLQQTHTQPAEGTEKAQIYASAFDMLGMRLITAENDKSVKIWGT